MASSSSSSSRSWKYDVFISFRGEDTRKTFVDHLYSAFQQHGILTYKDDVSLDRGDTIGPSLLKAIEESQILVIVFSENYADSSWCLDEISHIMKCRDSETGQLVIPIFYHVDPSDVRKQKGKYEEAFAQHEQSENNKNKVDSWKKALVNASNIAGLEPKQVANGHEASCIQEIVGDILDKLSSLDSAVEDEYLVGMGTRLQQLRSHLKIGSGGVRMVGIWGVGGGGKTTLATSLYMEFSAGFDGCCFVENVREESKRHGLKILQEKILSTVFNKEIKVESVELGKHRIKRMLCRRNVLIVLDDVDHLQQLEALAGYHNWFGNGSRIIITTRDEQVLKSHRVDGVCPVSLLSRDEAIRLFKRFAYQEHNPVEDFNKLSLRVISYVNGLPLALKILGAFLYGKDKDLWISTLSRLKDHPEMDIVETLKISYDGLKPVEKELFLDIACFFRRGRKDEAMVILDACGFHPLIGVKVLEQKALITVSKDGRFDMHDLVQEMGHYIVRGEHPHNPENHSRVWLYKDIEDICYRKATTENDKIEAIRCYPIVNSSNFIMFVSNMKKLRFLEVTTTSFDEGPSFLSNELRYLSWYRYPASLFPESFQSTKLSVLKLRGSLQKELWKDYKDLPCLKEIELSDMKALVRTPDIGGLQCLRKLILDKCESLEEIHQSLGSLSSLVHISVEKCDKLTRFPKIVKMEKLKVLEISYCKALSEFPDIEANLNNLERLHLYEVGIQVLPSSVGEYCTNLTFLGLNYCSKLKSIYGNFHALKGLQRFELEGCEQLEKLPNDLFNKNLDELHLSLNLTRSSIRQHILSRLPRSLRKLDLNRCELKDGDIPNEIGDLSNLRELVLRDNDFTRLDFSLSRLTRLKHLNLLGCEDLVELPELPSSLAILCADWCKSLEFIKDDVYRRCNWLCEVSIGGYRKKNIRGGERLLESMLQGKAVKSGCMILRLNEGLEIARGFEPCVVRGERCRMQLPENWYHHFSGFLFCTTSHGESNSPIIRMKHVEKSEKSVGDSQEDDDDVNRTSTWVTYLPFSLLRDTSWWDLTSTAIEVEFDNSKYSNNRIRKCGLKLVPKRAAAESSSSSGQKETTPTHSSSSSSSDDDDHYKCKFDILHDSMSALTFRSYER
uniref:TMV resistance protein N-like n=1 Tax=Erigeron canadensis TaxID=72917 RepID=UPI001CB93EF9|nr:TMV resistance protein N-like [Erigeron canadensis]XP_043634844.1 TMV resistance protein N-like [Erigeron canadensis]